MKGVGNFIWILILVLFIGCGKKKVENKPFVYFTNYSRTFNDLHDKHISMAKKYGITPIASVEDVKKADKKLVEIKSNKLYEVDKLTHSIPYLVTEASDLLNKIATDYRDSLKSKGLPPHSLIVTSVLRTDQTVKKLQKTNINASSNSAHLFGTTFDIAYARYRQDKKKGEEMDKLKSVLADVLNNLKKEEKCYVLYEVKQGCFHITVR